MQPALSTHVFLQQRLHPGLLDALHKSGAPDGVKTIEIFAARHHFDYNDRSAVRDIATWFRNTGVAATLHQPLYLSDRGSGQWSRHVAPNINLIDADKSHRITAMDEVKRALESAEQVPIGACILHLGQKGDPWDTRALENSLTAIEHLKAFAHPLGVRILIENLQNEITSPEHILEILSVGHFDRVGVCLDIGHAHLSHPENNLGIDEAIALLRPRIAQLHLHDNHGEKDEHLAPFDGDIDWPSAIKTLKSAPQSGLPIVLELKEKTGPEAPSTVEQLTFARKSLDRFEKEWASAK